MNFNYLPVSEYAIVDRSQTAHLRLFSDLTYCGRTTLGDVPTGDDHWKNAAGRDSGSHCAECDTLYRKQNQACPITYDF